MKIVIAPDSFKESLPAAQVAAALGEGVLEVCPDAQVDLCPMADGGEGVLEAMVAATNGRVLTSDTFGPLGEPMRAHFGMLGQATAAGLPGELGVAGALGRADSFDEAPGEGRAAVVETAAACGLALVRPDRRDPTRTTTFGAGKLLLAALDTGSREIIVGVGGSATVDGGCGCAQALGVTFLDAGGRACVCGLSGGGLMDVRDIDLSDRDPRIDDTVIRVACDVTNPLTGPAGAAAVYAPQKGATPEQVEQLAAALEHLAEVIRRGAGVDVSDLPGGGAAGGLAAGLVAFLGAKIESGADLVAAEVGLPGRLRGADLCLTGEGTLDAQSRNGKAACTVARMALEAGAAVICIPGQAATDAPRELFTGVRPLVDGDVTPRQAMLHTADLLKRRAVETMRGFLGW